MCLCKINIVTYVICCCFTIGVELSKQLDGWLGAADLSHGPARAIISPSVLYSMMYFPVCEV